MHKVRCGKRGLKTNSRGQNRAKVFMGQTSDISSTARFGLGTHPTADGCCLHHREEKLARGKQRSGAVSCFCSVQGLEILLGSSEGEVGWSCTLGEQDWKVVAGDFASFGARFTVLEAMH